MEYEVGQKVRIKSLDWYNENKDERGEIRFENGIFTNLKSLYLGYIMTVAEITLENQYIFHEDKYQTLWTDEMIECKVEEEVGLVDKLSSRWINEFTLPDGYIFKDENGNVINATKIVLEKKKKEYDKGTKVRHKTKGMVETVIGLCKIKYMGAWVDGVIYEGNDTNTGEPMTFVRVKEDFENNFEVWQH